MDDTQQAQVEQAQEDTNFGLPDESVKVDVRPDPRAYHPPQLPPNAVAMQDRRIELLRKRASIDRELAWLMLELGDNGRPWWTCQRCGHRWQSYRPVTPRVCASCHSSGWATPLKDKEGNEIRFRYDQGTRKPKRRPGRPSKVQVNAELAERKREFEAKFGPLPAKADVMDVVEVVEDIVIDPVIALAPLPPPPRSLSEELEARRMPNPRLPDPEPDPDPEPAAPTDDPPAPVESSDV